MSIFEPTLSHKNIKIKSLWAMAHEIIKNGIIGSLESLVEMAANITSTEGYIQPIDIDLLLEQIRKLYREVQMLDEENRKMFTEQSSAPSISTPEAPMKVVPNIITEPIIVEPEIRIQPETTIAEIDLPIEENITSEEFMKNEVVEPIPEPVNEIVQTEQVTVEANETTIVTPEPDLFSQSVSLAEKFKKEEMSINDQLKANQQGLNQKMTETPVNNLKTAIGINDKFMFVNELFKGQMKEYDEMISQINIASNLDSAIGILHENLQRYNSSEKAETVAKLERFIQRRFM
ncbi:MAG: hypothetical protein CVU11_14375 [Bacteroidetes bacterium HGW-Bacteroidetes-6]|nr:MAG: hypothetical protein CVU11_14375 [Bacteroidetes bacterium HGW-Bacteroidetes-6]